MNEPMRGKNTIYQTTTLVYRAQLPKAHTNRELTQTSPKVDKEQQMDHNSPGKHNYSAH